MKTSLITWNVNSIRQRMSHIKHIINHFNPDLILLQEIKCEDSTFPYEDISAFGFKCFVNGQKSYNGTAVITKLKVAQHTTDLPLFTDSSARYQELDVYINEQIVKIINIYAPQGQELNSPSFANKMLFYDCLYKHLKQLIASEHSIIIAGDYNIAYEPLDVHDPNAMKDKVGFHMLEREKLRKIYNLDMIDIFRLTHPGKRQFTWWDYRARSFEQDKGMRIDNILISPNIVNHVVQSKTLKELRGMEKPSDHAPLLLTFQWD